MTTPSFRDWEAMLVDAAVESVRLWHEGDSRWRRYDTLCNYILTRIERKEKALREQLAVADIIAEIVTEGEVKP